MEKQHKNAALATTVRAVESRYFIRYLLVFVLAVVLLGGGYFVSTKMHK
jgi:hypothetical protein